MARVADRTGPGPHRAHGGGGGRGGGTRRLAAVALAGVLALLAARADAQEAPAPGRNAAEQTGTGGRASGARKTVFVSHVGRETLARSDLVVLADVKSRREMAGMLVATFQVLEVLRGFDEREAVTIVSPDPGFLRPAQRRVILALSRKSQGSGYEPVGQTDLTGPDGGARLEVFRDYLLIESVADLGVKVSALRKMILRNFRAPEGWVVDNAAAEAFYLCRDFPARVDDETLGGFLAACDFLADRPRATLCAGLRALFAAGRRTETLRQLTAPEAEVRRRAAERLRLAAERVPGTLTPDDEPEIAERAAAETDGETRAHLEAAVKAMRRATADRRPTPARSAAGGGGG